MARLKLRLACGDYDRTRALIDGRVKPACIDLDVTVLRPREAFLRMLEDDAFDVCEMSLASHAILTAKGDTRFVGLPVMLSKMFRHSGMYVRVGASIGDPRALAGKRVGTDRYNSTGLIYMRGLLQHEYGIAPGAMRWCIGPLNDLNEKPQRPATVTPIAFDIAPPGRTLESLLEAGEIDAIFANEIPKAFHNDAPWIARQFADFKSVEMDYHRRTGIFPVMHIVVLREDIHRGHPEAAASLTRAFREAKDLALAPLYDSDTLHLTLPFLLDHIEEARRAFGPDIWSYGIEPNRPALAALGRYIHEQGLAPRAVLPEELFLPGL